MSDLSLLENLPPQLRALVPRAAACKQPLEASLFLDGIGRYLMLRDQHPEHTPDTRFGLAFGDDAAVRDGVPAWVQVIVQVLDNVGAQVLEVAAQTAGDDGRDRGETALLFLVEAVTRHHAVPDRAPAHGLEIARGTLSLDEALRTLTPEAIAAPLSLPPPIGRPLATIFAELEALAIGAGVTLQVAPLLGAASRFAASVFEDPTIPDPERVRTILGEGHPFARAFVTWFKFAYTMVEDLDTVPTDEVLAELYTRNVEATLYLLEKSIVDDVDADVADANTDAIVDGRLTLVEALTRTEPAST